MASGAADVWLRAVGGELVNAAAIIGLRCRDGEVQAILAGGVRLGLAGPGCPPEFHLQLLAEIAKPGGSTTTGGL